MAEIDAIRSVRRARNIVWNAAGRYDFTPPFLSFYGDGSVNIYMNMVVGLADKWLDLPGIETFCAGYGESRKAQMFDDLLWIGLENCLYLKEEKSGRPALAGLREAYAANFLTESHNLSRQQLMLRDMTVLDQQLYRWSAVLGRKVRTLTPREVRLAKALEWPASYEAEDIVDAMRAIMKEFFLFDPDHSDDSARIFAVPHSLANALKKLIGKEENHLDTLVLRNSAADPDESNSRHAVGMHFHDRYHSVHTEHDVEYLQSVFGKCIFLPERMNALEHAVCRGNHEECKLWYSEAGAGKSCLEEGLAQQTSDAAGSTASAHDDPQAEKLKEDIRKQAERNNMYMSERASYAHSTERRISASLDTLLSSLAEGWPVHSRNGSLNTPMVWREPILSDERVFLHPDPDEASRLSVTLLMDASASRRGIQERLALQAQIIGRSMELSHVPVQILTFRSLRGYTVLEKLGTDASHYFAAGWNRDGLALRAAAALMAENGSTVCGAVRGNQQAASVRVLLILTDAGPCDSTKIPPAPGHTLYREYDGDVAVKDTMEAVRELRKDGVRVGAIFDGPASSFETAKMIYGNNLIRIQRPEQFAPSFERLLERLIEMSDGKRNCGRYMLNYG